ncbi:hypothetical protein DSCO28_38050 [Desulfosarcina ovata subsp. sediminis]|uniref:Uncharacterized protein n=1 Tax=Desulfosarcina ovata subsp. sediminis TaxID=885957 RepID=A0A5K7ZSQ0_9BACT|nr:hypothetical protein [Desulfosarcina ovata]BBO83239.1 hypothetical protein DSCO28_38050 [Desulfosarcina ovata subsp. sediminis]
MFEFFSRKKSLFSSGIRTISIAELAPLWRDSNEGITGDNQTADANLDDSQKEVVGGGADSTTNIEDRIMDSDSKPKEKILEDDNAAWFDGKRFFSDLKVKLDENQTSAFRYNKNAYFTLDIVARALNRQRQDKYLEPMQPQTVIDFFQSRRILKSGKYVMRFDAGLPAKIYLYSHPCQESEKSKSKLPITENGRRLKSIKPMDKRKP